VTPAHTITSRKGRVYNIPKHIQSKQEAAEEAEDSRFMATKRALVRGFSVRGHTLVVATSILPGDTNAAKEICQNMGAFVYANPNRHFGLTNISVLGANGIEVSARIGLSGKVR
jgi:DNA transposition AAA+ family ATPase